MQTFEMLVLIRKFFNSFNFDFNWIDQRSPILGHWPKPLHLINHIAIWCIVIASDSLECIFFFQIMWGNLCHVSGVSFYSKGIIPFEDIKKGKNDK